MSADAAASAQVLSEAETRCLLESALRGHPEGVVDDDVRKIYRWAIGVRVDGAMLDMALNGRVNITLRNGEPCFRLRSKPELSSVAPGSGGGSQ